MVRTVLKVFFLLCAAALLAVACNRSPYEGGERDALTIYIEACQPCHQGGPSGPALAGRNLSSGAVEERLARGAPGMPSFPGIRGRAREDLVAFVVRMSGPGAPPPR